MLSARGMPRGGERDPRRQEETRRSCGPSWRSRAGDVGACGVSFLGRSGWGFAGQVRSNGWGSRGLRRERHNTVDHRHADGQVIEGPHEVISVEIWGTVNPLPLALSKKNLLPLSA